MAWTLMTEVYALPKDRLFVTYFGGCSKLGLEADAETREVRRNVTERGRDRHWSTYECLSGVEVAGSAGGEDFGLWR